MDETIKQGLSNLWKGKEAVGGKLFLTKQHLTHQPHKANIKKEKVVIKLSHIKNIEFYTNKVFGVPLMKNGLKVILNSNEIYFFVVNKREEWKEAIDHLLSEQVEMM
ncbi:GRAM domain-containing protein [Alkalibacillus silvisoli]|uniref:GRAM domain-containing protein n=1 Tax=Alkalibacillus silvisoli TaxID=392823 RepID=A0ABN1A0M5_9BACI